MILKHRIAFALAASLTALAACQTAKGPTTTASLRPMTAKEQADPSKISIGDILNIAANRKQTSCLELAMGGIYAMGMAAVANPDVVKADDKTRLIAGGLGAPAQQLIDQEKRCHCDVLTPMPGYELFERRTHLFKLRKVKAPRPEFAAFYPKDDAGNPRFLRHGEPLPDEVLMQLPPAEISEPIDDCGSSCRAARARSNAEAVAAGKEEPWPGLKPRPNAACTAEAPASAAFG